MTLRAAALGAIVLGVLVPAVLLLVIDNRLARQTQEPLIKRSRDSTMALATEALTEPLWTLNEPGMQAALDTIMQQPQVCAVELRESREGAPLRGANRCDRTMRTVERIVPIAFEGRHLGELRVRLDDGELDKLLADRQGKVLWLVMAQVMAALVILAAVLYLRFLRPLDRLKRQAAAIGERQPYRAVAWPLQDELGVLGQQLNFVHERLDGLFGEVERKNLELRQLALYDSLTGLPNRALFKDLFAHFASLSRRGGQAMAVLFVDLDRFKTVNDALGHAAGDALLIDTARRLTRTLRGSDVVCRQSGDEFLVLLTESLTWETVVTACGRILQCLGDASSVDGADLHGVPITASIGIALYPQDGDDFDTLVRHADMAMYQSKQQGRGRFSFFHPALNERVQGRAGMERELAHAIARSEFVMHYQPIVDAGSGQLSGCEALLRWNHPQRGLLAPGAFIAVAEDCGLIREIGTWTLEAVCEQIRRWKDLGLQAVPVAINVSALQFRDQRLLNNLQSSMLRHRVLNGEIEFELTESVLMHDTEATQRIVSRLRAMGVRLAVDDFGTGYSSLSYLKRLRPDKLKIDRSFVADVCQDREDQVLVEVIVRMARSFDIEVVAEGVETEAQRDLLATLGCERLQGYLLGRPADAESLAKRLPALA